MNSVPSCAAGQMLRLSLLAVFQFPFCCAGDRFELGQRTVRRTPAADAIYALKSFSNEEPMNSRSMTDQVHQIGRVLAVRLPTADASSSVRRTGCHGNKILSGCVVACATHDL